MFLLLVGNTENFDASHTSFEFIKNTFIGLFYMYVMYIFGKLYAVFAGFIERFD
jgi:hypothetical protein